MSILSWGTENRISNGAKKKCHFRSVHTWTAAQSELLTADWTPFSTQTFLLSSTKANWSTLNCPANSSSSHLCHLTDQEAALVENISQQISLSNMNHSHRTHSLCKISTSSRNSQRTQKANYTSFLWFSPIVAVPLAKHQATHHKSHFFAKI